MQCFAVGSARKGSVFSSSSRFFLSLSLSANMFVVMWLGLHRGSAGLVLESQRGVEVESVSLLCPSSSFSARVCSSRGPVPVCQLDLTVVCLVKSSFPVGQSRSTSGSPIWRRVRPRICGFVILGPRFCGGAFGSGQPHGLHLGPARDCYSWSGAGCVCLFDFRCGGAALLGGSSSSIKTRLWLAYTEERFDDDGDEQSTLQIMADTAVRFEKAAAEKAVADKTNEVTFTGN
ncbi:hypothetical protein Bca52824_057996 [Brassica carinata]|uniref:Uncharacterized protein n=1 Tax=Brassica carinata TaxID=52824 RepID=A0A8X7QSM8_BRACI|nr:hypothetical protein Bca52824_057996 [Brassica carinata]